MLVRRRGDVKQQLRGKKDKSKQKGNKKRKKEGAPSKKSHARKPPRRGGKCLPRSAKKEAKTVKNIQPRGPPNRWRKKKGTKKIGDSLPS